MGLYFSGKNPTCDLFILNPYGQVLLIKRKDNVEACPGQWALPGGFVDTYAGKNEKWLDGKETPAIASLRELKEETNLVLPADTKLIPIGVFTGNNRDPRDTNEKWTESHAFFYFIPMDIFQAQKNNIKGLDDADEAKWIYLEDLDKLSFAFDHKEIIRQGLIIHSNLSQKKKNSI